MSNRSHRRQALLRLAPLLVVLGWIGWLRAVPPEVRIPERQPEDRWRIAWTAEAGRQYRLERSADLRASGQGWELVAILTATNALVSAEDFVTAAEERRFYRVVELPPANGGSPQVSSLEVRPPLVTAEGWVTVDVGATDDRGVEGVRILDGATFLGDAFRQEGDTWRFLWQVGIEANGSRQLRAEARDADGNRTTSGAALVSVSIAQAQPRLVLGESVVRMDRLETNGNVVRATGNIGVGLVRLGSPTGGLVIDTARRQVAGDGPVEVVGYGLVGTGPYLLLGDGELVLMGTNIPFALNDQVRVEPTTLTIGVGDGAFAGFGDVLLHLPNPGPGPDTNHVLLRGALQFDPGTRVLTVEGTAQYRGVVGEGVAEVEVPRGTFTLDGTLRLPASTNQAYVLEDSRMALARPTNGPPEFVLSGRPVMAPAGSGEVTGRMDLLGALDLGWVGPARIGSLEFPALRLQLKRVGSGNAALGFSGSLRLPGIGETALAGVIDPGGGFSSTASTGPLQLGAVRITPLVEGGRSLPVLTLVTNAPPGRERFRVQGEFFTMGENGVQPIPVRGDLVLTGGTGGLDIESFHVTNRLDIPLLRLPEQVRLTNFTLALVYTNHDFQARFRGEALVAPETNRVIGVTVEGALALNVNDPLDVGLDVSTRVQRVKLHREAWLADATFRLEAGSRPAFARIGVINGTLGLSPTFTSTNIPVLPQRKDFELWFRDVTASFTAREDGFEYALRSGILQLPLLFEDLPVSLCPGEGSGASIALRTNSLITLEVLGPLPTDLRVRALGGLTFTNIMAIPPFDGFAAELCRATLQFNEGGRPYLTNVHGAVSVPLPPGQTNRIELLNGAFTLDGFPSGTLALGSNLKVVDTHGVRFTLLGRGHVVCTNGTALTVLPGRPDEPPRLILDGAYELVLPADLVTEVDGDEVRQVTCARLTLTNVQPFRPRLDLPAVAFGGNFHLGGEGGLLVTNGLLTLINPDNIFDPTPASPFGVRVGGTVQIATGPALTLIDAQLLTTNPATLPRFTVRGLGYTENEFALAQHLPARVSAAKFEFIQPNLPLRQLLHPTNVNLTFSAVVSIPSSSKKVFEGSVDRLKINIKQDGKAEIKDLDGFSILMKGLNLPPLNQLGGVLHVAGLSSGNAGGGRAAAPAGLFGGDISDLFLAGSLEGDYQGYRVQVLVGLRPAGMVGACVDFNAGSAGIPLDGGSLGGILMTGAQGGMVFGQGFTDPCEFTSFLDADGKPKPGLVQLPPVKLPWEDVQKAIAKAEEYAAKLKPSGSTVTVRGARPSGLADAAAPAGTSGPAPVSGGKSGMTDGIASPLEPGLVAMGLPHARYTNEFGLPCPGDCPPPTINLFCQPHPDAERFPRRVIARFSSIDEPTLNRLGFTRAWVHGVFDSGNDWAQRLAMAVAAGIRTNALFNTPMPEAQFLGDAKAIEIREVINDALASLESAYIPVLVDAVANAATADAAYDRLRDTAYGGAPCPDLTLSVSGTFTHTFVSSFLSGTGGGAVSSAGVAGLSGRINVLGLPVGKAKAFVAGTDERGNPNPSLCGEVEVEVGPLWLGAMRGSMAMQGAAEGITRAFGQVAGCLAEPVFLDAVRHVAPQLELDGLTRLQVIDRLSANEKVAILAHLYSQPDLGAEVRSCFASGIATLMADVNPELLFCGSVQPRLFGFPMGSELVGYGVQITKNRYVAIGSGSPGQMLVMGVLSAVSTVTGGTAGALAGPLASALFGQDRASIGYVLDFPNPEEAFLAGIEGRFGSPEAVEAYLDDKFSLFLENATYTFGYTMSPMGFKTLDSQARLVLPNVLHHPARPGVNWVRPENRPGLNLPSRLNLVLSALTNRLPGSSLGLLADPKWKGTASDLGLAFPEGSAERAAVAGLGFADDYFPHGGLVGGAYIQVPRALYEAPPASYYTALNPTNNGFTRLAAAAEYIQGYVLQNRQAGALGFYLPAPNPPTFTDGSGVALSPRKVFEGLTSLRFEDARFAELFPGGEFFLKGYIEGKLLDVPLAQAALEVRMASSVLGGTNAYFHASGNVPAGSWLDAFSPGAKLEFELTGAPPTPVETIFSNRLAQARMVLANPTEATVQASLNGYLNDLQSGLPKIRTEANLPLRMPGSLSNLVRFTGATRFAAYSARYEPGFDPSDTRPMARARREGGLAMEGGLEFRVGGAPLVAVGSGQLSVLPQPSGLPVLSGSFDVPLVNFGTVALRDARLDLTADATPRFSVRGAVDPLAIDIFRIEPLSGGSLGGRLHVTQAGPTSTSGSLFLAPALIRFGTGRHRIHGATAADEFGFSSTGPWNATLSISNTLRFEVGAQVLLEVPNSALVTPIALSGIGRSNLTVSGGIQPATTITLFPGSAWAQTLRLADASAATFVLRNDGTFSVSGVTGGELALAGLGGLSVSRLAPNATFTLDQDGLTLSGLLGGGVLDKAAGPAFLVSGTLRLLRNGTATVSGASAVSVPALGNSRVRVEALGGGNLSATLNSTGLALSGARLVVTDVLTNGLPSFSMDRSGDFRLTNGPFASPFGLFGFSSVRYVLRRTGGVLAIDDLSANLAVPVLNSGMALSGGIDSQGRVQLDATSSASSFGGHPLAAVSGSIRRATAAYPTTVLGDSPIGYWRLEEKSGSTAASSGVAGTGGTYVGGVTLGATGPIDASSAARFNGPSAYVNVAGSTPFDGIGAAITVEAWIRVNAFDRTWNTIVSKGDSTWRLQRNGNLNTIGFDTDGLNPPYLAGNRPVNDGLWHHVVATYDGRAKAIWIDGELDAWTPASGTINSNPAFPLRIGENAQSPGRYWNGWLDEVAVYGRALTPAQISEHYAAGGGLVFQAQLRLNRSGLSALVLDGTFASTGSAAFSVSGASSQLGGFGVLDSGFYLTRAPGGATTLFAEGNLAVPGIPSARIKGSIDTAGVLALAGSVPSGNLGGVGLSSLAFTLGGTVTAGSLAGSGNLSVPVLGTIPFSGSISADGRLDWSNPATASATVFGFPSADWDLRLRRQPGGYAARVVGDPLVANDRGDDPTGFWRLGENVGSTTANDSKKTAFLAPRIAGTYAGGVLLGEAGSLQGDANTAARFDGVNDMVTIGSEASFDYTTALTVEAWVRVPVWTRTWQAIVTKGDSSWRLSRFGDTRRISFETTSAAGHHSLASVRNLDDNTWHHVVATWDGTFKALYVDGVLESFTTYRETLSANDWPVILGENAQAPGRFFNGWLDEVALYGRALTPVEVAEHYVAGGGTLIAAAARVQVPNITAIQLAGVLDPAGGLVLSASGLPLTVSGFSLGGAGALLAKVPAGNAVLNLEGSLATPVNAFDVAGTVQPNGAYQLDTQAGGSFNLGGRTFTYSLPASFRSGAVSVSGTVAYGPFSVSGTTKVENGGRVSFTGTASDNTGMRPFGKQLNGQPGHPYAGFNWAIAGAVTPESPVFSATVGGTLSIEVEKPGGGYETKTFNMPSRPIGTDGKVSLVPGGSFQGISTFNFTLP